MIKFVFRQLVHVALICDLMRLIIFNFLTATLTRYKRLFRIGLRAALQLLFEICLMTGLYEVFLLPLYYWTATIYSSLLLLLTRYIFLATLLVCGYRRKRTEFVGNLTFGGRGPELRRSLNHRGENASYGGACNLLFNSSNCV